MKLLVYIECGDPHVLDDYLGPAIDAHDMECYVTLTVDGAPLAFEPNSISDPEYFTGLALACAGIAG